MLRRPVSQNLFKSNKWLSRGISLAAFLVGLQLAVVFFLAFGAGAPATSQASTAGASGRFGASSATGAAAAAAQRHVVERQPVGGAGIKPRGSSAHRPTVSDADHAVDVANFRHRHSKLDDLRAETEAVEARIRAKEVAAAAAAAAAARTAKL